MKPNSKTKIFLVLEKKFKLLLVLTFLLIYFYTNNVLYTFDQGVKSFNLNF